MAGLYAAFANGGTPVTPHGILRIETGLRSGSAETLYARSGSGSGVLSPNARRQGRHADMLAVTLEHGTGKAARLNRPAAGKTGTSQNFRDAWFAGYTGDLVTVVWVGVDRGRAMKEVTGGGLPAEIWQSFMAAAHKGLPKRELGPRRDRLAQVPTPD